MNRYAIIQLSDLQFGEKHVFGFPSNISNLLSCDIKEMSEKYSFVPMYLLLSGDISEKAHSAEFQDAIAQLTPLISYVGIDSDSVLMVPGNHDINRMLSEVSDQVGDQSIKFSIYNKFEKHFDEHNKKEDTSKYPKIIDHRLGVEFLLLNSCEKETHVSHVGYVDKNKLLNSLSLQEKANGVCIKIAVLHHRLDTTISDKRSAIENAVEIESILIENGYNIVITGHVHENITHEVSKNGKQVIYTGAGSAGVDKSQREDGVPNQYSIHVIDSKNKILETYWRSYNPKKRTKFGIGGWSDDNTVESNPTTFNLPFVKDTYIVKEDYFHDSELIEKLNIRANPFTYSNAEKISANQILDLFVINEERHMGGMRLSGDAIVRGRRGSGKTMFLRYLNIFGNIQFDSALKDKHVAESLPVMVNLSLVHRSEWSGSVENIFQSADRLIYDCVIDAIEKKKESLQMPSFTAAVHKFNQRLDVLKSHEGNKISRLGTAIKECLNQYFKHVLLLIDEIAPVFPREFFTKKEDGFLKWMNSIRNSGPYYTRVAVYPNDFSDILNEDRFGTMINLEYEVRTEEDYQAFRQYCKNIVNNYFKLVSYNKEKPLLIGDLVYVNDTDSNDALEQLIYTSDGSSRRFLSLIDKCIHFFISKRLSEEHHELTKEEVFEVIKSFSSNLLSGYDVKDKELALAIAKACKKQVTFRFQLPGLSSLLYALHSGREELNIVKIAELGTGRRGSTYEFAYPYCILMDLQTHNLKDTRKVCISRDHITGEWITKLTTIQKENLDIFNTEERAVGIVLEVLDNMTIVKTKEGAEFIGETEADEFTVGEMVSFCIRDSLAYEVISLKEE